MKLRIPVINKFYKYMKVKSEKDAHAVLSASGSERWLGCPASISLSHGRQKVEHPSAQVGTNAHTLLQFILENDDWAWLLVQPEAAKFKKHIEYSHAQLKSVLVAVKFILDERTRMKKLTGHTPEMYVEKKVKLEGVGFGTPDTVLWQPYGLLHVMDYKNGKSPVSPANNTQGLYYGVAVADSVGWDFKEMRITILQPNAPGKAIKTWATTPERLEKAKLMLTRGAALTRVKKPAVVPHYKYCWFCPARPVCPAHVKQKQEKIMSRFERK